MSVQPPVCRTCGTACEFGGVAPFAPETLYGVSWRCVACGQTVLDVCPVGPAVPSATSCLNCGDPYRDATAATGADAEPTCADCGNTRWLAERLLRIPPPGTDLLAGARTALGGGLFRHAVALLNTALLRDPTAVDAWVEKSRFLVTLGFNRTALTVLEAAVRHTDDPDLLITHGYHLQEAARPADAVAAYETYLARRPAGDQAGVALGNMANALKQSGEASRAEAAYRRAVEVSAVPVANLLNYARFLLDQKRWSDALAVAGAGLDACSRVPDLPDAALQFHEDRAVALAELGRGDDAVKAADAALLLGADRVRAHFLRGRALALVGRLKEARVEMDWVLSRDPGNADALRGTRMIDAALGPRTGRFRWKFWA